MPTYPSGRRSTIACTCCSVCPTPPGKTGATSLRAPPLENEGARREVVGKTVVDQVAMPETGGIQRAGPCASDPSPPPAVRRSAPATQTPAWPCHGPGVQAAKGRCLFCNSIRSRLRVSGNLASASRVVQSGIDPGQRLKIVMRRFLGVRHLAAPACPSDRPRALPDRGFRADRNSSFQISPIFPVDRGPSLMAPGMAK